MRCQYSQAGDFRNGIVVHTAVKPSFSRMGLLMGEASTAINRYPRFLASTNLVVYRAE